MLILQNPKLTRQAECPYLPEETKQFRYFFATDLSERDLGVLLSHGWRKFGNYYFRPDCPACQACVPLRVLTDTFKPSKSQRKTFRKNQDVTVRFGPLKPSQAGYDLYQKHGIDRFDEPSTVENFLSGFYSPSCPALQSEFYLGDQLIALGFLDRSEDGLSSVYFVYDTELMDRRLGVFGALKEIEYAREQGLPHYYLGYHIAENQSMAYKAQFKPHQRYDWTRGQWNE